MGEALPVDKWPAADSAVAALWGAVGEVDAYVENTTFFPGGWSKSDARVAVANAKSGATFFANQTERLKRGELESPTAYADWRSYPSKAVMPLVKGIYDAADFASVDGFTREVVSKTGADLVELAPKLAIGGGVIVVALLAVFILARR